MKKEIVKRKPVTKKKGNYYQPQPVRRITCPKCNELMLKVYPYASFNMPDRVPICTNCQNKLINSGQLKAPDAH